MLKPSTRAYIIKTTCSYNRDKRQSEWFLSLQSKQKQNKIKIGIFTVMFLMQYFSLKGILPFSKSCHETESTWSITKCKERKSFDTWYYIVTCATVCVKCLSKSEANNVFPKHVLKSKARGQSIQLRKNLFCHVIIKNYFCVSWKFLIKVESTCRRNIKEQATQLILLYRGSTVRSSHRRFGIRKLFLKVLQYPQETPVL